MAAFAGIVAFDGGVADEAAERHLAGAVLADRDRPAIMRRIGQSVFAQRVDAAIGNRARHHAVGGTFGALDQSDKLFVASARLDNRAELADALTIDPATLAGLSDGDLLNRMLLRWGEAGIARCLGAFAFVQWDATERRLTLGRDCLGGRALFFHRGRGFVAFASTLTGLLAMPDVPRQLDEDVLANFLALNLSEQRRTFYRGIERVPSRTLIKMDRDRIVHRLYWSPDLDAPPPYRRDEDYVARARELFDQAVAVSIAGTPHFAIATSGGLDSSAVAATAAGLGAGRRIACYTIVPPAGAPTDVGSYRYRDETDKVAALARMYPALDLRLIAGDVGAPLRDEEGRRFATMNTPALGPAAMLGGAYKLYDAVAAERCPALLVGNYGNFGLSWSGQYSLLALLRAGQPGDFLRELIAIARNTGHGVLRTIAHDLIYAAAPIEIRRLMFCLIGRDFDSVARYSSLNPAYIAESGLGRQWRADGFNLWPGRDGWQPQRYRANYLFDDNQSARDHLGMFEDLHGYAIRDPHADRRLLEFALSVPEPVFRRNGVARSFARTVFADRLPRVITDERRRGANAVAWFSQMQARRQDIAAEVERLEASPTARRLIDLPRLKRLLDQWPKDQNAAERRSRDYRLVLGRGVHVGRFIRWVEGGNA
ncbi:MAG: hypothetical protein GC182_07735 [Rhodopseudomonas sp.]|nr:hypothetical protein [Rhodopseudomonas sp.]